jgi:hypothetical protein
MFNGYLCGWPNINRLTNFLRNQFHAQFIQHRSNPLCYYFVISGWSIAMNDEHIEPTINQCTSLNNPLLFVVQFIGVTFAAPGAALFDFGNSEKMIIPYSRNKIVTSAGQPTNSSS